MASQTPDDLFSILQQYDEDKKDSSSHSASATSSASTICPHLTKINENGTLLCCDCGLAISTIISYEKDWRYYGSDDTRKNSDPNRCHIRKIEDKSIFKDVESYHFPEKIVNTANDIYTTVTNGKIYRGKSRKALIFGCIHQSIKMNGKSHTCESLRTIFGLDRKSILKGLKYVNLKAPKSIQMRSRQPNSNELIEEYMDKFDLSSSDRLLILDYFARIRNRSTMINRSRPQSVASALIYYFLCQKYRSNNVNMVDFIHKVNLSELTILKIYREIDRILSTPVQTEVMVQNGDDGDEEEDDVDEEEEEHEEEHEEADFDDTMS